MLSGGHGGYRLGFHIILMEKTVKEIIRHHTRVTDFNRTITADDSGGFHT